MKKAGSMNQIKRNYGHGLAAVWLAAGLLTGVAYGQAPGRLALTSPSDQPTDPKKVVLRVGDASVTEEEMEQLVRALPPQTQQSLAQQGRRPLGDRFAMTLLLSQDALSHHLDSGPAYQDALARARREILASLAYQEISNRSVVTADEVTKYYSAHRSEFEGVQLEQFVVRKKAEGAKAGTPGFTADEAKAKMEEIRKAVLASSDLKPVAEKYQVASVVRVDAEPHLVRHGQMRADMDKAVFALKDGEATEVFDTGASLVFFKVVTHDVMSLVAPQIENTLRQQKVNAALEDLKKNAKIWMDDAYFGAPHTTTPAGAAKPAAAVPGGNATPTK
jgi:hypothetical protein